MDNPDYSKVPYPFIYRASAIGGCLKAQAALQLGYSAVEVPEFFKGLFKEGRLHEDAIVKDLEESGYIVWDREGQAVLPITSKVAVVGHIDGKLTRQSSTFAKVRLLEMKTMTGDAYKAFAANGWDDPGLIQKYKWQVSVYMLVTELPATLIAKNKNNGRIIHMDIEEPFYTKAQIMARVLKMHNWVISGQLPVGCEEVQFPCPVPYLHDDPEPAEDHEEDEAEVEQVRAAGERLRVARAVLSKAKDEEGKARAAMLEVMKKNKYEGIASKYEQKGSSGIDWELMREDGIDVEKYKKEGSKSWRVRLEKVEGEGDNGEGSNE